MEPAAEPEEPFTILYLDDSDLQLRAVADVLKPEGYRVRTALSVNDAVRQLDGVDLIVIDFHMPEMAGSDALRMLQPLTNHHEEQVACYLYTSDREVAVTFKRLGFDGAFIGKGEPEQLPSQVATACRVLKLRRYRRRVHKEAIEPKVPSRVGWGRPADNDEE